MKVFKVLHIGLRIKKILVQMAVWNLTEVTQWNELLFQKIKVKNSILLRYYKASQLTAADFSARRPWKLRTCKDDSHAEWHKDGSAGIRKRLKYGPSLFLSEPDVPSSHSHTPLPKPVQDDAAVGT